METHASPSLRTYILTFVALMILLAATVGVAFLDLGPLSPVLTLLIASVKALLVVMIFMHVRGSTPLTKLFVFMGLLWLVILFGLTLSDYLTRVWQTTVVW